jgi:hypothetical protein
MAKNLPHCETGFGVYSSAQLTPHLFFLLLHLFSVHTLDRRSSGVSGNTSSIIENFPSSSCIQVD